MPPLNAEQLAAVRTREGVFNIVSVPGSGKTTCFVVRSVAILGEDISPSQFLGLTFTKSAAEEMEKRSGYKRAEGGPKIFRTFHGWALDFVSTHHHDFPFQVQPHPLLLPHDLYKILGPLIKQMPRRAKYKDMQSYISEMKRKDVSPEEAMGKADNEIAAGYARVYEQYERKCQQLGKFDFDSLLTQSVRLLESRPDILSRVQPTYLQCDEAQDNDKIQWRLIQLLGGKGNVFVVGDTEQNMYSWRGAEADGLLEAFDARFPGAHRLKLLINYRSTQAIINYLREISPGTEWEHMRSAKGYGKDPEFKKYIGEDQEAEMILMSLADPDNTAILARTNRQLAAFEKAAGKLEMKYKLLGKSGFFSQHEIESTIAFAQYCAGAATDDCVRKIIRSPFDVCRFIKKAEAIHTLERLQAGSLGQVKFPRLLREFNSGDPEQDRYVRELRHRLEETRQQATGKSSQDALRNVITNFGILHHYQDDEDAIDNNPADNVMSLLRMAEKRGTLLEFVQMCHKAKQASRSTAKRLCFSTVHQAKGLEWKHVYVVGCNADVMPHKNGEPGEELRIYRVACSRAADFLTVSSNEVPSVFIKHKLPVSQTNQAEVDFLQTMYLNAAQGAAQ